MENRQSNFNEFTGQMVLAAPLPANLVAPPGPAPQIDSNRGLYNPYKKDFQPRVGFAYTPAMLNKKVVLRGAYTISSYLEGTGTNLRTPLNPPFNSEFQTYYNTPSIRAAGKTTLDQGLVGPQSEESLCRRHDSSVGSIVRRQRSSNGISRWTTSYRQTTF